MQKPSLFVGSSTEGLEFARALRALLGDVTEVTLWREGVFGLGRTYIESLVSSLSRFDFAALLLTPDDPTRERDAESLGPRDNVIFELGLFMGRLGRERTFIVRAVDDRLKIPSDLAGVAVATYEWPRQDKNRQSALGPACDLIRQVIRDLGFSPSRANVEISAIKVEQAEQRKDIEALQFLVRNFVTSFELVHLRKLATNNPFPFKASAGFETELRHLLAMGLIRRRPGRGISSMFAAVDDVQKHLEITPEGRNYLKLRGEQSPAQAAGG